MQNLPKFLIMDKDQIKTLRNNGTDNGNAYASTGKMCWRLVGRQWKNDKRNANANENSNENAPFCEHYFSPLLRVRKGL